MIPALSGLSQTGKKKSMTKESRSVVQSPPTNQQQQQQQTQSANEHQPIQAEVGAVNNGQKSKNLSRNRKPWQRIERNNRSEENPTTVVEFKTQGFMEYHDSLFDFFSRFVKLKTIVSSSPYFSNQMTHLNTAIHGVFSHFKLLISTDPSAAVQSDLFRLLSQTYAKLLQFYVRNRNKLRELQEKYRYVIIVWINLTRLFYIIKGYKMLREHNQAAQSDFSFLECNDGESFNLRFDTHVRIASAHTKFVWRALQHIITQQSLCIRSQKDIPAYLLYVDLLYARYAQLLCFIPDTPADTLSIHTQTVHLNTNNPKELNVNAYFFVDYETTLYHHIALKWIWDTMNEKSTVRDTDKLTAPRMFSFCRWFNLVIKSEMGTELLKIVTDAARDHIVEPHEVDRYEVSKHVPPQRASSVLSTCRPPDNERIARLLKCPKPNMLFLNTIHEISQGVITYRPSEKMEDRLIECIIQQTLRVALNHNQRSASIVMDRLVYLNPVASWVEMAVPQTNQLLRTNYNHKMALLMQALDAITEMDSTLIFENNGVRIGHINYSPEDASHFIGVDRSSPLLIRMFNNYFVFVRKKPTENPHERDNAPQFLLYKTEHLIHALSLWVSQFRTDSIFRNDFEFLNQAFRRYANLSDVLTVEDEDQPLFPMDTLLSNRQIRIDETAKDKPTQKLVGYGTAVYNQRMADRRAALRHDENSDDSESSHSIHHTPPEDFEDGRELDNETEARTQQRAPIEAMFLTDSML